MLRTFKFIIFYVARNHSFFSKVWGILLSYFTNVFSVSSSQITVIILQIHAFCTTCSLRTIWVTFTFHCSSANMSLSHLNEMKVTQNAYYQKTLVKFEFERVTITVLVICSFTNGKLLNSVHNHNFSDVFLDDLLKNKLTWLSLPYYV